jgi:RNA polymerase sigma factor (sigma-70 family)
MKSTLLPNNTGRLTKVLESEAFTTMVRAVHRRYRRFLDLDDFRQNVLLRAWEKRGSLQWQDRRACLGWLYVLARRLADGISRKANRAVPGPLPPEWPDDADTPEQALVRQEQRDWLRDKWAALDHADQELLHRRYDIGEQLTGIAEERGVNPDTLRHHLARLLTELCKAGGF